jgi:hypothetical protein
MQDAVSQELELFITIAVGYYTIIQTPSFAG